MKILILGDSFAMNCEFDDSWTNILAKKLNANVEVIARGGQAFYYCYHHLQKRIHNDYDIYIILVTEPTRLYVNPKLGFTAQLAATNTHDVIGNAANEYFNHLLNLDYVYNIHALLLDKTKEMLANKKHLFFPCFNTSGIKSDFTLFDIVSFENKTLHKKFHNDNSFRLNHLIPENNEILAQYFYEKLTIGNSNISIASFISPTNEHTKRNLKE